MKIWNCLGVLILVSLQLLFSAQATEAGIDENTMKAVYSFSFGKFTHWPELPNQRADKLGFCIFGENPFSRTVVDSYEGRIIKGRKLRIQIFDSGLLADDALPECQILYVSQSEKMRIRQVIDSLSHQPILTVSDIQGFSNQGGMITLVKSDDRITFEINPGALTRAGISISSKILELAKVVHTEPAVDD
ncbi:MAG: YfiR family protein [Gammaproteobacteria bacterium]|nr:YfiR family protein [Gammaproteobacteria bacterium]